ncbi:MAG TPA: sodium/solute symporter [Candidatus Hydrogenedentes bacterium]|nr:sodium/solute symporter [Candidatus Hydrogenedentota bacterium]
MGLALTGLDWMVCLLALIGSIFAGLWMSIRAKTSANSAGFFLAGRSLTWPIVGASLYATNIGAEHLVGLAGDSYRYGLCAGTVELTTAICLGFASAVLLPYYLKNKVYTIPEFLELRYNKSFRVCFSGLMLVICIMTKTAFTLYAGALVLHLLTGWDVMTTVAILGALAAVITMIGGFTTVAYTDTIQTAIMLVGSGTMVVVGLIKVGGWHALCTKVPEAMVMAKPYDDPNYPFWGVIAGAVYGGVFYWGIDQVNVQRMLGARDLKQARWGAMFAILLKLTPVFLFALPGVIALALFPGREAKLTFATMLNELLPSGLRGLLLASLLAAMISSLLAVMNSISTLAVRDFLMHFRPGMNERQQVTLGRVAIILGAVLGIGAAYMVYKTPDGLYKYLQTISIYLVMPVTPAIVFGILSKRVNERGALISVGVGVVIAAIFVADQLMGAEAGARIFPWLHTTLTLNYTYRGLWGTLIVIAVLFLASGFEHTPSSERLTLTTINWSGKPESFQGLSDWRLHLTLLSAVTIALYAWLW